MRLTPPPTKYFRLLRGIDEKNMRQHERCAAAAVAMRQISRDEAMWIVREVDARHVPGARGERCLIYETDGIVRRVWTFPTDWAALSDDALWELVDEAAAPAQTTTITPAATHFDIAESLNADTITKLARVLFAELVSARDKFLDADGPHCGRRTRAEMRAAIQGYARSLRRQGIPPERVLVLLKDAVQTGLAGSPLDEPLAESLLHDGVEWCIDAYFTG